MKRRFLPLAAVIAAIFLPLCSCTGSQIPQIAEESTPAAVSQTTSEPAPDVKDISPDRQRRIIVNNSMLHAGSSERFRKVFEKAKSGEEITVAYIGGSITEGYTVKPDECWAYLTYQWLCEKYPDAKINYVNAGLSGTPSTLGLIRADRDVIAPFGEPDIVFIEFAVNDANDTVNKEAYESLVRKMLTLDSEPAVALMFMRTKDGYSCQNWQSEIGKNYNLPMISVNDALSLAFADGYMTWEDYSNDEAHPNPEGCKLIAEMTEHMLSGLAGDENLNRDPYWDSDTPVDPNSVEPVYGTALVNMHLADASSITPVSMGEYSISSPLASFPNAWTRKGGGNEGITFETEFCDLFLVYHCNNSSRFGTAQIYVDGELKGEASGNRKDGWSNPVTKLVMRSDCVKKHTVEIKMKGDAEKQYFGILAFGYTR